MTNLDYIMLTLQVKVVRQRLALLNEQIEAKEIESAVTACRNLIGKASELLQKLSDVLDDGDYMHEGFSDERLENGDEETSSTSSAADNDDA